MTQFCSECTYLEIDNFNEADLYGNFIVKKGLKDTALMNMPVIGFAKLIAEVLM